MEGSLPEYPNGDPWVSVSNFNELLNTNLLFIEGKIPRTPYHCGPLNDETTPLIESLKKMHSYGMMTTGGQPGIREYGVYIERTWVCFGLVCGNWFVDTKQKANVDFIMEKTNNSLRLVSGLLKSQDLVVYVLDLSNGILIKNENADYTITKTRSHKNKDELKDMAWFSCTSVGNEEARDVLFSWEEYPKIYNILKNTFSISVSFKKYGVMGVEDRVMEMYAKILNDNK